MVHDIQHGDKKTVDSEDLVTAFYFYLIATERKGRLNRKPKFIST